MFRYSIRYSKKFDQTPAVLYGWMFVWKKDESKDVVDSSLCIRKNNGMDVARVWCNPYSTHIVNVSLCKIIKETKYIYIDRVKSSNWNSRKS